MSSIQVNLEGELEELLQRLHSLSGLDKAEINAAIAEGIRSRTQKRFEQEKSPEGKAWQTSIRAAADGGRTLTDSSVLRNSIHEKSDDSGMAVGTNDIRAATHQFGGSRTIRPKRGKYLTFQVGGHFVRYQSVRVDIPARPFLGFNDEDMEDIRDILEAALEG